MRHILPRQRAGPITGQCVEQRQPLSQEPTGATARPSRATPPPARPRFQCYLPAALRDHPFPLLPSLGSVPQEGHADPAVSVAA